VYGTNSLLNFAPFSKFSGTTSQRFGSASGPYGALQAGNSREPIRASIRLLVAPLSVSVWRNTFSFCSRRRRPPKPLVGMPGIDNKPLGSSDVRA